VLTDFLPTIAFLFSIHLLIELCVTVLHFITPKREMLLYIDSGLKNFVLNITNFDKGGSFVTAVKNKRTVFKDQWNAP
jgi:hypothetical protein